MSLAVDLTVRAVIRSSGSVDLGNRGDSRILSLIQSLADGTGAGQVDRAFVDRRTLAASATEDLDLSGTLAGAFGDVQAFVKVKALLVQAAVGNTNDVNVSRPASNGAPLFLAAGDGLAVKPGGILLLAVGAANTAGYPITAGTGDLVTLTNAGAGTSVTYDVAVLGTSA